MKSAFMTERVLKMEAVFGTNPAEARDSALSGSARKNVCKTENASMTERVLKTVRDSSFEAETAWADPIA
jgi:hypothetical protein